MNEPTTRPGTRPHDWAEVVLGTLIALDGLASLAMPGMVYGEGIQIVLGVLLFLSPWVMGYADLMGASWTAWIGGVLTVVAGAAAMPIAQATHKTAGQH